MINDDFGDINALPPNKDGETAQLQQDLDAAHQIIDELREDNDNLVIKTVRLTAKIDHAELALKQSNEGELALLTELADLGLQLNPKLDLVSRLQIEADAIPALQNSPALAKTRAMRIPLLDEEVSILKSTLQTLSTEKQSAIDAGRERECALQNQLETTKRSQEKAVSEFIAKSNRLRQDFQTISNQNVDLKQEKDGLTSQLSL